MVDYSHEMKNSGNTPRKFMKTEVISLLSKAYVYLGNTYELVEATPYVLQLIQGQHEYATGSTVNTIPSNILRIHTVKLTDSAETQLDKAGYIYMPKGERIIGLPGSWTVRGVNANRKLIINSAPAYSYTANDDYGLTLYYKQKLIRYSAAAVPADSFSDIDFDETDWGGSFLLPTEWDDLIIGGAVAYATGNKASIADFYRAALVQSTNRKEKSYVNRKPRYFLGIKKS